MGKYYKQACSVCGIIDGHTKSCSRASYIRVDRINTAQATGEHHDYGSGTTLARLSAMAEPGGEVRS